MSTPITYNGETAPFALPSARSTRAGFFKRFFQSMVAAREAQALRYVSGYLSRLSDEQLENLGLTRSEIRDVRSRANGPASYWV
jgi:hypothetical protein